MRAANCFQVIERRWLRRLGCKSPVGKPDMKMKRLPSEAKRGRATDRVKEG
jgi:hypothetical protein